MTPQHAGTRGVIVRDLILFELKLLLDGAKDVIVSQTAIGAAIIDLATNNGGRCFYAVLRLSERFDLWLNLHVPASSADSRNDGLFGASLAGSDSLLGKLEQMIHNRVETGPEPRTNRRAA